MLNHRCSSDCDYEVHEQGNNHKERQTFVGWLYYNAKAFWI